MDHEINHNMVLYYLTRYIVWGWKGPLHELFPVIYHNFEVMAYGVAHPTCNPDGIWLWPSSLFDQWRNLTCCLCFLHHVFLSCLSVPAPPLSLLWLGILGAAGRLFPTSCILTIVLEVFVGKIKRKLKEICTGRTKSLCSWEFPLSHLGMVSSFPSVWFQCCIAVPQLLHKPDNDVARLSKGHCALLEGSGFFPCSESIWADKSCWKEL